MCWILLLSEQSRGTLEVWVEVLLPWRSGSLVNMHCCCNPKFAKLSGAVSPGSQRVRNLEGKQVEQQNHHQGGYIQMLTDAYKIKTLRKNVVLIACFFFVLTINA